MATVLTNVSFDGSPVQFRLDSPLLVCLDPLSLDMVRDQLESLPVNARMEVGPVLERLNGNDTVLSCYQIPDFEPGMYALDPRDIKKFGDEDEDFDYNQSEEEESEPADRPLNFPFVSVDSGALIVADFSRLPQLVHLLTWEQYDLALQDESVFGKITDSLGGAYFAVIVGACLPGMEFDGDGTYSIKAGAIRRCHG